MMTGIAIGNSDAQNRPDSQRATYSTASPVLHNIYYEVCIKNATLSYLTISFPLKLYLVWLFPFSRRSCALRRKYEWPNMLSVFVHRVLVW